MSKFLTRKVIGPKERDVNVAFVLLSGGQDSTTSLAWALAHFEKVQAISFDYGQRHSLELEAAKKIAEMAQVKHTILAAHGLNDATKKSSGLVNSEIEIKETSDLPTSFVPGRNILFATLAAGFAYGEAEGPIILVMGVSQEDYSGYPDCRAETISSLQTTLSAGLQRSVKIETPLMYRSKAESIRMMEAFGKLDWLAETLTCYEGKYPPCGECLSCKLRAKGFAEAGVVDPLLLKVQEEQDQQEESFDAEASELSQ